MNFIKKNIKKILNKKNRKFLIVAIALIAAIAFYFYFNKENFSAIETRLSKEERNEIQLALKAIWKSTPKGTGNEKRDILQKCRSLLRKDKMTYDDIEYVQNSLSQLSNSPRIKKLMNKFDTTAATRKMIREGLKSIYEAAPNSDPNLRINDKWSTILKRPARGSKKTTIQFIRDKMGKPYGTYGSRYNYNTEITEEDHKKIISRFKLLIRNSSKEEEKIIFEKYNKITEDSLAKLREAE
jgi:hypothetical protein